MSEEKMQGSDYACDIPTTPGAPDSIEANGFRLTMSASTPEVWVHRIETDELVAYSSTEADRKASIEEFVSDYLS